MLFLPLFPCMHPEEPGDGKNNHDASLQPLQAPRGRRRAGEPHMLHLNHVGLRTCLSFESWVKRSRAQQNGSALRHPVKGEVVQMEANLAGILQWHPLFPK